MQRLHPAALVVGAIALYSAGYLTGRYLGPFKDTSASASRDGGVADAGDAGRDGSSERVADEAADVLDAGEKDAGVYGLLLDGTHVPPIPPGSPKQVRFGVVLVAYAGADPGVIAPGSGHQVTRSRLEAKVFATALADTARTNFKEAVSQGDQGSAEDLGRIPRGVLEPAADYVLFTLPVDGIGGPVETPRGFWIIKRLE